MGENSTALKRGWHYDKPNNRMEVWVDGVEVMRLKNNTTSPSGSAKELEFILHAASATEGSRQAFYIDLSRTTAMTTTDGNPDCALKLAVNENVAGATYNRARLIDGRAKIGNGYAGYSVNGLYITCEVGTGSTATDSTVADFEMKNNGVTTTNIGVLINDQSQGTTTSTYGLKIYTSNYNPGGGRLGAIFIDSQNTTGWTSGIIFDGVITNAFEFIDTDGTGAGKSGTYSSGYGETPTGTIKVKIGSGTKYIYCHTDAIVFS